MLEARSFKGEIIITQETRTDVAVQWQWRLLRMGYAHTVIITRGEHSCGPLRKLFGDHAGCVWFGRTVNYPAGPLPAGASRPPVLPSGQIGLFVEEAGYWKLQLAAMVARLGGYNLLLLDTDTLVLDDFYWWMRQPDYAGYQLLAQRDSLGGPSSGVLYLRGAAPGGPSAWLLAEAVGRNVRWREQPALLAALNSTMHTCYDESSLTDALWSALAGRPLFARCLGHRQLDRAWSSREDGLKAFEEANARLVNAALRRKVFSADRPGPRCHAPLLGGGSGGGMEGAEGELRVPQSRGEWPAELGGRALGEVGPVAAAFVAMMREAGTPMWPDPESPAAAAADSAPPERFAFLSRHAACDWAGCGAHGMFAAALRPAGQEPCVVIGHLGASPDRALSKRFQLLAHGAWSPDLAAALHGPGGSMMAAATGSGHYAAAARAGVHHGRLGQQIPLPKLLALAPWALSPGPSAPSSSGAPAPPPPLVLGSKEAYVGLVHALSSVALATGRTLALPRLGCDFPWMHRPANASGGGGGGPAFSGRHSVPWTYLAGEAFAPFGPSLDSLGCEWYAWLQHGCLHGPVHVERRHGGGHINPHPAARMLLSAEMDHFLFQIPPEDQVPVAPPPASSAASSSPSPPASLIPLPASGASGGGGDGGVSAEPGPDGVYNVTMAALAGALGAVSPAKPILWLERPMRVVDLPAHLAAAHQQWVNHCCGLSWPRSVGHICFPPL